MSISVESTITDVSLDWIQFFVESKGKVIQPIRNNTVGLLDEGVKAFGQLIFNQEQPDMEIVNGENPCILGLLYNLQGKSKGEIQVSTSTYSVTDDLRFYQDPEIKADFFNKIITDNLNSLQEPTSNQQLDVFNYQKALNHWNISYIACRNSEIILKFANDPAFSLVFINNDVAIFLVEKGFA